jgi:hypothetical protein
MQFVSTRRNFCKSFHKRRRATFSRKQQGYRMEKLGFASLKNATNGLLEQAPVKPSVSALLRENTLNRYGAIADRSALCV